jgi:CheY-like chemotaxis protein
VTNPLFQQRERGVASILVVDDDDNMRRLIRTILERRGHEVSEARDGLEGLTRFEETLPDLVVTDIAMPGIGGMALIAELQRRQFPPKVLVVSGKQFQAQEKLSELAASGLVRLLDKPFTPAELAQSVQVLVG